MCSCLSMLNLLAALIFSAAPALCAGVGVTSIRQPGSSLDLSLQNECGRAIGQSAVWLQAAQRSDGSWGSSNAVLLTSVSLFALSASGQPGCSETLVRAALWLDAHATNLVADLETHAWRLLALAHVLPDARARRAALRRLADAARQLETESSAETRLLWNEAQAAAGLISSSENAVPDAPARLTRLAASWPLKSEGNRSIWQQSHLINRAANGQLLRGNTPLDWRCDFAQRLVNAQRNDPAGGGYWDAPSADAKIAETAFGLLALLEL